MYQWKNPTLFCKLLAFASILKDIFVFELLVSVQPHRTVDANMNTLVIFLICVAFPLYLPVSHSARHKSFCLVGSTYTVCAILKRYPIHYVKIGKKPHTHTHTTEPLNIRRGIWTFSKNILVKQIC